MRKSPIVLPALGEGIREARVLSLLKEQGEAVKRDDSLAEVETDKAVMVIESPASGVVDQWFVRAGEIYPVGTLMTLILEEDAHPSATALFPAFPARNRRISPRVRAWCLSEGIDPDKLPDNLASGSEGRVAVADIERWRSRNGSSDQAHILSPLVREAGFDTAAIERHTNWVILEAAARKLDVSTSEFVGWCIFRAMERQEALRSFAHTETSTGSGRPVLGVAVALLRDGLAVAAVDETSPHDAPAFFAAFRRAVSAARSKDKPQRPCSVVLSDMSSFGVRSATPIVVPPSLATLFIGEPFQVPVPSPHGIAWSQETKLVLAFNHNRFNGAGAARFLRDIHRNIEEADKP